MDMFEELRDSKLEETCKRLKKCKTGMKSLLNLFEDGKAQDNMQSSNTLKKRYNIMNKYK